MEFSEGEVLDWWQSPVGCEIRQELRELILKLNEAALSEPVVRDPIKGAIYLGKKEAFQEMLEWGEPKDES